MSISTNKNFASVLNKFKHYIHRAGGGTIEFDLSRYRRILDSIRAYKLSSLKNEELAEKMEALRGWVLGGADLDNVLPETYALVAEAIRRRLSIEPFDGQVVAGIAMHYGKLVEMNTGEGKTIAAVFSACLNALAGKGVHVMTANDYLARRDAAWMGPVYRLLGLEALPVQEEMTIENRQLAYEADITYLTAHEAGFDFLRDQARYSRDEVVHRPFNFAIVDEADFMLIDEARVPLVVAGEMSDTGIEHGLLADFVRTLKPELHFEVDENMRDVNLTEEGILHAEASLGWGSLYDSNNQHLFASLNVALHAEVLLRRDIDYIVRGGTVELVDAFTGRVAKNRRWPHGIHQAVEAKEGLVLQREGQVLGSITLQHFLRLYPKISGMTATAQPAAEEFKEFYNLDVVVVPPNKICRRVDHADVVFTRREFKLQALAEEIGSVNATGRPVLVGTGSVEESELLARLLEESNVTCRVLNAKNDEREAAIIADAGSLYAVTISTNMAGRGTDIRLGGADESLREEVLALGGLYVIGTNRHESRRIDDQLRGRAGRQGDPGSSRFFISLDDDLMIRYHLDELIPRPYMPAGNEKTAGHPVILREINRAQRIIEGQNFEIRKTLWGYSEVIEEQRKIVCRERRRFLLDGESPGVWESDDHGAKRYLHLCKITGKSEMERLEIRLFLSYLDRHWAEHLSLAADVKEGIHLYRYGGRIPLAEFQQVVTKEFSQIWIKIEEDLLLALKYIAVNDGAFDLSATGIRGSSTTWTYLINDNPFGNPAVSLAASRNIGMAAYAGILPVLYWPVTLMVLIWRFAGKRRKNK